MHPQRLAEHAVHPETEPAGGQDLLLGQLCGHLRRPLGGCRRVGARRRGRSGILGALGLIYGVDQIVHRATPTTRLLRDELGQRAALVEDLLEGRVLGEDALLEG